MKKWLKKPMALPAIVVLGILAFMVIKGGKLAPSQSQVNEYATPAHILNLSTSEVTPKAIGYGTASPSSHLNVPAEVSAEVVWVHPKLKQGENLKAGEQVVKFERRDFELAQAKVKADLNSQSTRVAELDLEERNAEQQLQLSRQKYQLAQAEFKRKQALAKQGAISSSTVDSEQRNLIAQQTELGNMKLKLALYPKQRELLGAQIKINQAQLEEQLRNLERTQVSLPFNARIGVVNIEKGSFINKGNTLFVAQGKNNMEVLTQIAAKKMLPLFTTVRGQKLSEAGDNLQEKLRLTAKVFWVDGPKSAFWPATVLRGNDSIDSKTRSIGLIVGIDNPQQQEILGIRPPLFKGMFLRVEITGLSFQAIKIPRSAIHQGKLYLMDDQNRLVIEPAKVAFSQGDYSILQDFPTSKKLVLSDIIPAVEGMLLLPVPASPVQNGG